MSKESAYAAPAVIFGFAAAGNRLRESRIRLALIANIAVCATMFAYRWSLFHGPGGYMNPATGQPQVLSFHLGSALKALFLRVWANLLFPVNWDASAKSAILAAALAAGAGAIALRRLCHPPAPAHRVIHARAHHRRALAGLPPGIDRRQPQRVAHSVPAGDWLLRSVRAPAAVEAASPPL